MKITEKTKVIDALKKSKSIIKVFEKHNLDCPGCKGAGEDTIEKTAMNNGLDIKEFLHELNSALEK